MNYQYVVDSSFRPFSAEELVAPLAMYKDAYEKAEEGFTELSQKAGDFSDLPEGSRAKSIYDKYSGELSAQAEDLAKHGLTMNNRRALVQLKRRYQNEIGQLEKARTAFDKERELRRQASLKDPSMLYAQDNLNIDDFLNNNQPNLYGISGMDLYTRGAAAGKAASSRIYSAGDGGSTLGGYYKDYIEKMGYTPEDIMRFGDEIMEDFTNRAGALPELKKAAQDILEANGVTDNLTGNSLKQAQQQVIRGIVDGAIYNESHRPIKDEGVLTEAQRRELALKQDNINFERGVSGWKKVNGQWVYDEKSDVETQRAIAIALAKKTGNNSGSGSGSKQGSQRTPMIGATRLEWGRVPTEKDSEGNVTVNKESPKYERPSSKSLPDDELQKGYSGKAYTFDDLPDYVQDEVLFAIGKDGNVDNYIYYFEDGNKPKLDIIPVSPKMFGATEPESDEELPFGE